MANAIGLSIHCIRICLPANGETYGTKRYRSPLKKVLLKKESEPNHMFRFGQFLTDHCVTTDHWDATVLARLVEATTRSQRRRSSGLRQPGGDVALDLYNVDHL